MKCTVFMAAALVVSAFGSALASPGEVPDHAQQLIAAIQKADSCISSLDLKECVAMPASEQKVPPPGSSAQKEFRAGYEAAVKAMCTPQCEAKINPLNAAALKEKCSDAGAALQLLKLDKLFDQLPQTQGLICHKNGDQFCLMETAVALMDAGVDLSIESNTLDKVPQATLCNPCTQFLMDRKDVLGDGDVLRQVLPGTGGVEGLRRWDRSQLDAACTTKTAETAKKAQAGKDAAAANSARGTVAGSPLVAVAAGASALAAALL